MLGFSPPMVHNVYMEHSPPTINNKRLGLLIGTGLAAGLIHEAADVIGCNATAEQGGFIIPKMECPGDLSEAAKAVKIGAKIISLTSMVALAAYTRPIKKILSERPNQGNIKAY